MVDILDNFCPIEIMGGNTDVSWVAVVGLFLTSEIFSYLDIEPNGVLQAFISVLRNMLPRRKKEKD